jgi:hypothetical protein
MDWASQSPDSFRAKKKAAFLHPKNVKVLPWASPRQSQLTEFVRRSADS